MLYRGTERFKRALEELCPPPRGEREVRPRLPTSPKLDRAGLGYEPPAAGDDEQLPPALRLPCPLEPLRMASDDAASPEEAEAAQADLRAQKSRLDGMHRGTLQDARGRANPYEAVGRGPFVNRAAVKLAEIDARLGLTELLPLDTSDAGTSFHFVDLCSGPGGFSEYLYWREEQRRAARRWRRRPCGWGVTLRGRHGAPDFDLRHLPRDFRPVYGPADGDLMHEGVAEALRAEVALRAPEGVQLVTADGGAEVSDFNDQEREMLPLLRRQAEVARAVLAPGGAMLLKVFDTFEPATVEALCSAAEHFESVEAVKPVSSRPANSERYVVLRGFRRDPAPHPDLAPRLRGFAVRCARRQVAALRDVLAAARDRNLLHPRAGDACRELLRVARLA